MSAINRIILVGNGFDLAHGLATRYADFINWYWKQWASCLLRSPHKIETDELCSFGLKDSFSLKGWYLVWQWHYQNPRDFFKDFEKKYDIIDRVKGDTSICDFKSYSIFFDKICPHAERRGWVDIENEYFDALNKEYFEDPAKLNQEFEIVRSKLITYLSSIQETGVKTSIIDQGLKQKIFAPIRTREIAISARKHLLNFIDEQCSNIKNGYPVSEKYDRFGLNKTEESTRALEKFAEEYHGGKIKTFDLESIADDSTIPAALLRPGRVLLLNFNYTRTADLYMPQGEEAEYWFPVYHIHGELEHPDSIIFGYGDELDDRYGELVKLNNNEHLRHIKSIKYLETDNYRKLLAFIDSAPYQVCIMGHSCGNTDRTLLNTLFEHRNCVSIKPFYHAKEDGTDNYLEMVQNISRNFTDMKLMRDRVVNKTYCAPLLPV